MKNKALIFLLTLLISCASLFQPLQNCEIPAHSPFPGGIINVDFTYEEITKPNISVQGKVPFLCKVDSYQWKIIYPISLEEKNSKIQIKLDNKVIQEITIVPKNYRVSKIEIANLEMVTPPKKSLERIENESKILKETVKTVSQMTQSSLKMELPTLGIISSEFGVKRFINGKPRSPHSGTDIAAPTGTDVRAALNGKVMLIGNFYYAGNVIYIDHGQGLLTSYSHLEKIKVTKGQKVLQNQIIGSVGKTGRVTGPHLHWQTILLGTNIDPTLFLNSDT